MRLGGYVATELGDTDYTDDVEHSFTDTCDLLDELIDCYQTIRDAAKEAGDTDTREAFHGVIHDLKLIYQAGEQKLQQISAIGLPGFLATQL